MEAALPENFYYIVGVLVVMSAGALISGIGLMIKVAMWVGEFKAEVKILRKDNDAAHAMIREIKKEQGE